MLGPVPNTFTSFPHFSLNLIWSFGSYFRIIDGCGRSRLCSTAPAPSWISTASISIERGRNVCSAAGGGHPLVNPFPFGRSSVKSPIFASAIRGFGFRGLKEVQHRSRTIGDPILKRVVVKSIWIHITVADRRLRNVRS